MVDIIKIIEFNVCQDMNYNKLANMEILDVLFAEKFDDDQSKFMIGRQVQLAIGCCVLLFIIGLICKKKLIVFNTTRMLMFCCVCYFVGMFIVLLHQISWTAGYRFAYDDVALNTNQHYIFNILEQMKKGSSLHWCGFQAFINLFMYNLAYFFAILISYNVFCVINDNYKNFMKNVLKNVKVLILLGSMLVCYALPLIFMETIKNFKDGNFYSYGPAGFKQQVTIKLQGQQYTRNANLLFFCGTCFDTNSLYKWLAIIQVYLFFPVVMLFIHSIILWENHKKLKNLKDQQFLNAKQRFLVNSGNISIGVFAIQLVNALKLLFSIMFPNWYLTLIILNYVFDLYPFVMLYFFIKYTKQKRGLQHGSSTLISQ